MTTDTVVARGPLSKSPLAIWTAPARRTTTGIDLLPDMLMILG